MPAVAVLPFEASLANRVLAEFCPELKSPWAQYPLPHDRWLNLEENNEEDGGIKQDYVYCKHGLKGKGYYHVLTKVAYVNLYSRLMSQGPPGGCGCLPASKNKKEHDLRTAADDWDTARRIVYARSRCSKPDDAAAWEQQIDHWQGTKLNPTYGLKA